MPTRLERLTLRNFRGATQPLTLTFDKNRPVVVIFGENGSGKSTLVDAIDFACNNAFGSLADRSSTKPASHIMSQGATAKDVEIVLTAGGVDWTAKLASSRPQTKGPAGQVRPTVLILRRSNITQIMDLTPGKKYDIVKEFIALPRLERAESSLRDAAKAAKGEFDATVTAFGQAWESLDRLWKAEGQPQGDMLAWANAFIQQDVSALRGAVAQTTALLQLCDAAEAARERLAAGDAHLELQYQRVEAAQQALAVAERGQAGSGQLVGLLTEAQSFLQANPSLAACPVCGEPNTAAHLLSRVSAELEALRALAALRTASTQATSALTHAEGAATGLRRVYLDQARQLATALAAGPRPAGLDTGLISGVHTASDELAAVAAAHALLDALQPAVAGLTQQRDEDQKALTLHNAVINLTNTVAEKQMAMTQGEALAQRLAAMVEVVARERKAHIEKVLAVIAGTVDDLYARMHPNEPLGQLKMSLKEHTAGSLEMSGAFGANPDVPPAAYYSDSHLDTLGLCVYLALARHNQTDTFIVLDDVLTSVDDAHQDRIIQVLHEEAAHFGQVIITTHLRTWRDRYKLGQAAAGQVQLLELHSGWNPQRGIQASKTSLNTDELRHYLGQVPMDRQIVASKAGVLLESLLDGLALRYQCRVPRKPEPHYTLGELLGALETKLRKALTVERLDAAGVAQPGLPLQALLDELGSMTWIRNQVGAHFNPDGQAVPDSDVQKFADRTLDLAAALACPACGATPDKNKSGSHWDCGGTCRQTRLHPLKQPA